MQRVACLTAVAQGAATTAGYATVASASASPARKDVLALYKNLYRIAKLWPVDETRPGRDLGTHIKKAVREQFRTNASVTDQKQVATLVAQGQAELGSLRSIYLNQHHDQFIRTNDTLALTQQSLEATRHLLSSNTQRSLNKKSFMQLIFGRNRNQDEAAYSFRTPAERQRLLQTIEATNTASTKP
ncbi:hypothetical protein CAOG_01316 [Capsaspora owczarzaki ATCC 30864]|uniref:Mitochondrial nucleoid factor 1 n=1 Tax=Capsaspora owczarzaki (strain ATCC 30864) TaxID=595528 RepID=A0A0D2X0Z4_CAPO3|nr:hypothetical protein CAOG_01316 [Capsaspora owczarzaki ATCC 30864]KJE89914.1 hypothetical protein CAOG_001316 [Capsaspora owczarzaki ATCC 30864]|eukprot:XP_004349836.1 hypothetical protein CAOG_01316 [Capsaspora owczarzaki ATCC 30864]